LALVKMAMFGALSPSYAVDDLIAFQFFLMVPFLVKVKDLCSELYSLSLHIHRSPPPTLSPPACPSLSLSWFPLQSGRARLGQLLGACYCWGPVAGEENSWRDRRLLARRILGEIAGGRQSYVGWGGGWRGEFRECSQAPADNPFRASTWAVKREEEMG
jgi:hypothetical protein